MVILMSQQQTQTQIQEQEIDYATIIAIACDVSLILEKPPVEEEDEDIFHPMWVSEYGPLTVTICHHNLKISINIDNISREQHLALIGVVSVYDYEYDEFSFDHDEEDEDEPKPERYNPFQDPDTKIN